VFDFLEELIGNILLGIVEYDDIESVSKIYGFAMRYRIKERIDEIRKETNMLLKRVARGEVKVVLNRTDEEKEKVEIEEGKEDKATQTEMESGEMEVEKHTEEKGIQAQMGPVIKEVVRITTEEKRENRDKELDRKIEEILERMTALEKRGGDKHEEKRETGNVEQAQKIETWATVTRDNEEITKR